MAKYYKNILFWLALNFLVHLFFIQTPPAEPAHAWRQCLTNMMARNFVQENAGFFYPQIDIAGEHLGVIGSEFPLYQYLLSILYRIFGFEAWCGRLLALIFTTLGIWFFYKLTLLFFRNPGFSFLASCFLMCSLWFSFSWKSMPDIFCVTLALISVYYFLRFRSEQKWTLMGAGVLFAMLGILSKIPAALVLSPLVLLVFEKHTSGRIKLAYLLSGIVVLIPVYLWYGKWVPHLVSTYHFELYFPRSFRQGLEELGSLIPELMKQFLYQGFSSVIFSMLAFGGVVFAIVQRKKLALSIIGVVGIIGAVYIIKTGLVFPTHSYYLIPFGPFLALSAAWFVQKYLLKFRSFAHVVLALGCMECVGFQWNDFFVRSNKKYLYSLEKQCNTFSNRRDKIVCNGSPNPQLMYFLNRKGWSLSHEQMMNQSQKEEVMRHEPAFIIFDKHRDGFEDEIKVWSDRGSWIFESEDLKVFKPLYQ